MDVLIFLGILSFLVIIHELGHFLTARKAGMKVEEFGLGYPPKAVTLYKDKAGTEYTLNWLPFGGFVRIAGEDSSEEIVNSDKGIVEKGMFFEKPVWQRLIVVLAGASINFIFGVIAFGAIYTKVGIPAPYNYVKVMEVSVESPAEKAGLKAGDKIVGVLESSEELKVTMASGYIEFLSTHAGKTVTIKLDDGRALPLYVRNKNEIPEGQGATGVRVEDFEMKFYPWYEMPFRGMWVGLKSALEFGLVIVQALGTMVGDLVTKGIVPKDVAGPVGIAYMAQKEGVLTQGWLARLNFMAILSINLAIMNVLPLPALDGGRVVFLLYEMVFRRKVKPIIEQWVNTAGFLFLITLIVLISIKDVMKIFNK